MYSSVYTTTQAGYIYIYIHTLYTIVQFSVHMYTTTQAGYIYIYIYTLYTIVQFSVHMLQYSSGWQGLFNHADLSLSIQRLHDIQISHYLSRYYKIYRYVTIYTEIM